MNEQQAHFLGISNDAQMDYKALYFELLYAVGRKYPGESRHQTALRYIRRSEEGKYTEPAASQEPT